MYKSFEPGYGYGVGEAVGSSSELRASLVRPDSNNPDTETILALSNDLAITVGDRQGFTPQYEIGQAKSAVGEMDRSVHKRFGDAVTHELFIIDLLESSHAKPFVADFDKDNILRGIILALDRENDGKFETLWESVGINYPTVYIAGVRPSEAEVKAIAFMRGINPENTFLQAPWFLRVGMASADETRSVRTKMQLRTHYPGEARCTYVESSKKLLQPEAIFSDGERYKMFVSLVQKRILDQSTGLTLKNYQQELEALDENTYYFDAIDSNHKYDPNLLMRSARPDLDLQVTGYEDDLLFVDELTGYEGRLVAGRFLVQTVTAFIPGDQWIRVGEIKSDEAENVQNIIKEEKDAKAQLIRRRSIF